MDYIEHFVEKFLTQNGVPGIFVVWQWQPEDGDNNLDFAGIDFKKSRFIVTEATQVSTTNPDFVEKFRKHKTAYEEPLRRKLASLPGLTPARRNWPIVYVGFVRRECLPAVRKKLEDCADVDIRLIPLEDVALDYQCWGRSIDDYPNITNAALP